MTKTLLLPIIGALALVLNPFFACGGADFAYGDAEMRAAVEGSWKLTLGAPAREIVVSIAQAKAVQQHSERAHLVRSAAACSHRSFVRSAEACMDVSEMPLAVIAHEGDKVLDGATGTFMVVGLAFTGGNLELDLDGLAVTAKITPHGEVASVESYGKLIPFTMAPAPIPVTLTRVAR